MTLFPEDPRSYLRKEYEERHQRNPAYSWRSFARDLKVSPSMLSEFLKGRYGLSRGKATAIAQAIRLDQANTDHFIDLLEAGFHRMPAQRELARVRSEERLQKTSTCISRDSLTQIMDWTYFALLEVIGLEKGSVRSEGWLAPFRLGTDACAKALAKLRDLNLLRENEGRFEACEEVTIAGDQMAEEDTRVLHQQMLELSGRALTDLSPTERESLSIFVSMNSEDFGDMRKEMNDAMLQILNKFANRPGANGAYAVSLQAFPIYKK